MNLFEIITAHYPDALITKTYERQEVIFEEHEPCTQVGLVLKGKIQIATYSFGEEPYVMSILTSGDTFGETLLFSADVNYYGTVLAIEKTKIGLIPKNTLLTLLQQDPHLLHALLSQMANKSILTNNRLKVLLQKSIRDKILFYLHEQVKVQASATVQIPTKEALAIFLNIPRPSLSRELQHMAKEGLVSVTRKTITLIKT